MTDYEGSIAQQNVTISTDVYVSSTVGENFYRVLMLLPVDNTNFTGFKATKANYVSQVQALLVSASVVNETQANYILNDLASFFSYAADTLIYVASYQDYAKYKYAAYFVYYEAMDGELIKTVTKEGPDSQYDTDDDVKEITYPQMQYLNKIANGFDNEFSTLLCDVPVFTNVALEKDLESTKQYVAQLAALPIDVTVIARSAETKTDIDAHTTAIIFGHGGAQGYSPSLYQLGRSLSFINSSGYCIGNSLDMVACNQADVLITGSTSIDEMTSINVTVATALEDARIGYFKPIGNSTGQVANVGGWTIKGNALGALWITAYINYMVRVATAEIITVMNTYRSAHSYNKILITMANLAAPFISLGRIERYSITAPDFASLPSSKGDTITIPNAWEGYYVDNVRRVKIQGTLYVQG